jgi:integrase
VNNRDPAYTNREDVKRTLARWPHPNRRSKNRAILVSFYRWMVEDGYRPANPAEQTKRPRRRKPSRYRLTTNETLTVLAAVRGERERRLIYLGVCAGLRRGELIGMQGRHFRRPGWVCPRISARATRNAGSRSSLTSIQSGPRLRTASRTTSTYPRPEVP